METVLNITGMTCGHCVSSVTEELTAVPGVEGVDVTLNSGQASAAVVRHDPNVTRQQLSEAVAEAGYTVVAGS
ncbi:Copper chaperone CopZ [Arthrobacter saudimassiliensis]|uniref:Copper chaperone CopZ n=1 Tax=Arthrobacter saudimassiliensis TaxID=1461584 RepID=A0A078MNK7_9MICC|nr:Copper chaperone CopZ [Arthrobacter saudimassiliensis]